MGTEISGVAGSHRDVTSTTGAGLIGKRPGLILRELPRKAISTDLYCALRIGRNSHNPGDPGTSFL